MSRPISFAGLADPIHSRRPKRQIRAVSSKRQASIDSELARSGCRGSIDCSCRYRESVRSGSCYTRRLCSDRNLKRPFWPAREFATIDSIRASRRKDSSEFSAGAERSGRCSRFADFCRDESQSILLGGKGARRYSIRSVAVQLCLIRGPEPKIVNVISMKTGKKIPKQGPSYQRKQLAKESNFNKLIRDALAVLIRRGEIKIPGKKRRP